MYEWLRVLSCLSGNIYYGMDAFEAEAPSSPRRMTDRMRMKRHSKDRMQAETPDLQTQYEELLDTVWRCDRWARVEDRIDAQARFEQWQSRPKSTKP